MAVTESDLVAEIRGARAEGMPIEVVGTGTLLDRLPAPPDCRTVRVAALCGITSFDPADLRVTVRAGTHVDELAAVLAKHAQECPIEGDGSTVGGRIASGLSGPRRFGTGPLRDWVLGARVIVGTGSVVSLGGGTVKNVTAYDLVRLLCGSWGTLGAIVEVTLRVRPMPAFRGWFESSDPRIDTSAIRCAASILRTRLGVHVLLEGNPDDCAEQARRHGLREGDAPRMPTGARLSVRPSSIRDALSRIDGEYVAELGVGIIHANPSMERLAELRAFCESDGGRLLVLAPDRKLPPFGSGAHGDLQRRVRAAFDPDGLFAPWRFAA
jgi:FAD/FMN-containing dehydrogenase